MITDPAARAAVRAAVDRAVSPRFSLSMDAFVDLLLARAAARAASTSPVEYANRLRLDDLYLASACAHSDDEAWREFRDRYLAFLRQFARPFTPATAVDVADQVMADLWQRRLIGRYDGRSSLRTWLGTVVAHAAINAGKIARRTVPLEPALAQAQVVTAPPADEDGRAVFASIVMRALRQLDGDARLLLLLYYEQGLTLDQMEVVTGASKATLSRRLAAVRATLRDSIEAMIRTELRTSSAHLLERLDVEHVEVDLAAALGRPVKGGEHGAV